MIKTPTALHNKKRVDYLYGGSFDIANVNISFEKNIRLIKSSCLFYDKIVIPDSFFHSQGPIFKHVKKVILAEKDRRKRNDDFLQLLFKGIIVCSLRKEGTLYDNWLHGVAGIKGGHLNIQDNSENNECMKVLSNAYLDNGGYLTWPDEMALAKTDVFHKKIIKILFDNDSHISAKSIWSRHGLDEGRIKDFENMCISFDDRYKFRRGVIEEGYARLLGIRNFKYDMINKPRIAMSLEEQAVKELVGVVNGVYSLYQADQFGYAARLNPNHDAAVPKEYLGSVGASQIILDLEEDVDFSYLTADDIHVIRTQIFARGSDKTYFQCAVEKRLNINNPNIDTKDSIADFYDYVRLEYIPAIMRAFPPPYNYELRKFVPKIDIIEDNIEIVSFILNLAGIPIEISTKLVPEPVLRWAEEGFLRKWRVSRIQKEMGKTIETGFSRNNFTISSNTD